MKPLTQENVKVMALINDIKPESATEKHIKTYFMQVDDYEAVCKEMWQLDGDNYTEMDAEQMESEYGFSIAQFNHFIKKYKLPKYKTKKIAPKK